MVERGGDHRAADRQRLGQLPFGGQPGAGGQAAVEHEHADRGGQVRRALPCAPTPPLPEELGQPEPGYTSTRWDIHVHKANY
ncbi:hypothetical protein GCM10022243_63490 [Saccharothrix violaceirubra]